LSRRDFIVALPGTKQRRWLEENAVAAELAPSAATLAALDAAFRPDAVAGARYPAAMLRRVGL
jgi:hypothetical protein